MGKYIILSKSQDNDIRYISNTSPLLWTDNKEKAKIFISENQIQLDLFNHMESLEQMKKGLNLQFEMVEIT